MILALDTASPVVSVALHGGSSKNGASSEKCGEIRIERSVEIGHSSRRLLEMVDEVLEEAGVPPADLSGIVTLRGPGSFTGLRVGLATAMGLHQALGTPATAIPTLEVLAASAVLASSGAPSGRSSCQGRIVAAVDVLRGEWAAQPFRSEWPPRPEGTAERVPARDMARFLPCTFVGYGLDKLRQEGGLEETCLEEDSLDEDSPEKRAWAVFFEPPPLAAVAARLAAEHPPDWDPGTLTEPLYFRPPPVTLPTRRPGAPRNKKGGRKAGSNAGTEA